MQQDFDIAILGGGPTGSALALLLARMTSAPERLVLLQSASNSHYGHRPELDPRVLAVNHGSRVLLESLGAWPQKSASIQNIHVSQRGRLGRTLIRHHDFDVPALGYVVRYGSLHARLAQAVQASGIHVSSGAAAHVLEQDQYEVRLEQGPLSLRTKIAIQADGAPDSETTRSYTQVALLARARASLPRANWAFERFTQEGPLAVLPHPDAPGEQSIVWCCTPERAKTLMQLTPSVPLAMTLHPNPLNGRCVTIGNASQTLHPVAGQGLNLGQRDAAALAIALRQWLVKPEQSPSEALEAFVRVRAPDRQVTARLTDLLARVFTTKWPVVEHAAGLALLSMDLLPVLRAPLARHLLQGLRL